MKKYIHRKIICMAFVLAAFTCVCGFESASPKSAAAASVDIWPGNQYASRIYWDSENLQLRTVFPGSRVMGYNFKVTGRLKIAGYTLTGGVYDAVKFDIWNASKSGNTFSFVTSWPSFLNDDIVYDFKSLYLKTGERVELFSGEQYKVDISFWYMDEDSYGTPYDSVYSHPTFSFYYAPSLPLPPNPVKEGHTFKGWYLDAACTLPYDGRPITEDLPLYAGWTINTYTLTLDANGGQSSAASVTALYDTVASLPVPTRYGYTFKGWKKSDGNIYNNDLVKGNMTLTAEWEPIILTVTFYVDGAVYQTMDVRYGDLLSTVQVGAQLVTYDIKTVSFNGGIQTTSLDELVMVSDAVIVLEEKQGLAQLGAVVLQYLPFILIGAGVAIVLSVLPYRKLKRKR